MQIKDLTKEEIRECFNNVEYYLAAKEIKWIKYLDLGCKVVRLISYSDEFLPHVEKQLTYILRDNAPSYDATLFIWKETDFENLAVKISDKFNPKKNMRLRIDMLYSKQKTLEYCGIIDKNFSKIKPAIDIQIKREFFIGNDKENNTYYYGVGNLDPEEFIKEGHIFVQFLNNILKTEDSNLAHGAVIGLNGDGILMCARGQRGKSTLSVLSMMEGFEYVSDDYLIMHQNENGELLTSPIYSIITLSPKMYNELYNRLEGSRFVSNNARKDKYVINILNFHDRFKMNYPIKICLFPEIVTDKEPSIRPCTAFEKGRAMVQLIQSTLMQTQDLSENWTVKKMMNMIKNYPFYKFNLCHNVEKNTEFLRDFMNNLDKQDNQIVEVDKIAVDITFDLANILNTDTGIIYSMNKLATSAYEYLLQGYSKESVLNALMRVKGVDVDTIIKDFELFVDALGKTSILKTLGKNEADLDINTDSYECEWDYKLSFIEHANEEYKQLIKEKKDELCIK